MSFKAAQQVEIIRSNQKDQYYQSYIRGAVGDIFQSWFGPRSWLKWRKELDLVAEIGYFCLTTVAGYQTLGEEYVNILQVDSTRRAIPTILRRGALVLLHILTPYALQQLLLYIEKELRDNPHLQIRPEARQQLNNAIPVLRHVITVIHRCHLAAFYMKGVFYHIAKRITGIRYLLVRQSPGSDRGVKYRILGWLAIIQLTLTFIQQLYKAIQRRKIAPKADERNSSISDSTKSKKISQFITPSQKCPLCLEGRNKSTATPCGHLFCWDCITEWCENKSECPICRQQFQMSRLIFLQNFDPD